MVRVYKGSSGRFLADERAEGWSFGSVSACWDDSTNVGYPFHDLGRDNACPRCGERCPSAATRSRVPVPDGLTAVKLHDQWVVRDTAGGVWRPAVPIERAADALLACLTRPSTGEWSS